MTYSGLRKADDEDDDVVFRFKSKHHIKRQKVLTMLQTCYFISKNFFDFNHFDSQILNIYNNLFIKIENNKSRTCCSLIMDINSKAFFI